MTKKQFKNYEVIVKACAGIITVSEAAEAMGISERQIKRQKKKYKEEGAAAFIHGNSMRIPSNRLPPETAAEIVRLKRSERYADSNFKHFRELLWEHHEIEISYPSLYRRLKSEGINSPHTRRRFKPHRRRKRRPQAGLLLQVDATPFAWFKGDKRKYALHGGIDDATGQVTGLYMCKNECLHGYFEMKRRTIRNYGIPVSTYADRHTIFQSPNRAKAEIDPKIKANDTQFGRCLRELGVTLIAARSPQAKGRIERLWGTLQDRLPVEFAIRGITTVDAANEFLESYIYMFNSEFAVEPESAESMFSKPEESVNLDYVLCVKEQRTVDSGGVFSYGGRSFKVTETVSSGIVPKGAKVSVLADPKFGIKIEYRKIVFDVLPYVPPRRAKESPKKEKTPPKPVPDTHYFKYGQKFAPKLSFAESNEEIISMLEDIFLRGTQPKSGVKNGSGDTVL
jgi:transposase